MYLLKSKEFLSIVMTLVIVSILVAVPSSGTTASVAQSDSRVYAVGYGGWPTGGGGVSSPAQTQSVNLATTVVAQIDATGVVDSAAVADSFNTLVAQGLVNEPGFTVSTMTGKNVMAMLELKYGANLANYPFPEGRIWLLYVFGA